MTVNTPARDIDITLGLSPKGEAGGVDRSRQRKPARSHGTRVARTIPPTGDSSIIHIDIDVVLRVIEFTGKSIIKMDLFKLVQVRRGKIVVHRPAPVLALVSVGHVDLIILVNHAPSATIGGHITGCLEGVITAVSVGIDPIASVLRLSGLGQRITRCTWVTLATCCCCRARVCAGIVGVLVAVIAGLKALFIFGEIRAHNTVTAACAIATIEARVGVIVVSIVTALDAFANHAITAARDDATVGRPSSGPAPRGA